MRRPFVLVAIACGSFALSALLLARVAPYPEMGDLDDKLRFFEIHRHEYDTLVFGSSRILRGVVPEELDAEMGRHGAPSRSFNFGIDGMAGHETAALVRRVLALEPARLRRVVVELPEAGALGAEIRPENRFKARAIFWHDRHETGAASYDAVARTDPADGRLRRLADHLLHGLANATAAGRGRDALVAGRRACGTARGAGSRGLSSADLVRNGGFEPFSESAYATPSTHPFRRHFLSVVPAYRQVVKRLPAINRPAPVAARAEEPLPADEAVARLVERVAATIRAAGAEPVFLVTPTARPTPELYRLAAQGRVPGFVAFNDPSAHPSLFAVENRFDADHLTTDGARLFSRALAARLAGAAGAGRPEGALARRNRETAVAAPGGR